MTAVQGCDYANARPSPAALYKAGIRFVVRYLSPNTPNNPGKRVTAAEIAALRAAGIAVCFVWETTSDQWHGDGAADYRAARSYATSIGVPANIPIYLAVDADVQAGDLTQVRRYIGAAVDAAGKPQLVGVYGGLLTVKAIRQTLPAVLRWQTYAWSHGQWDTNLNAAQTHNGVQVAGVTADLDEAYTTFYGQWEAAVSTPTVATTTKQVWDVDYIPSGDPANPTWVSKNALAWLINEARNTRTELGLIRTQLNVIQALMTPTPPAAG